MVSIKCHGWGWCMNQHWIQTHLVCLLTNATLKMAGSALFCAKQYLLREGTKCFKVSKQHQVDICSFSGDTPSDAYLNVSDASRQKASEPKIWNNSDLFLSKFFMDSPVGWWVLKKICLDISPVFLYYNSDLCLAQSALPLDFVIDNALM